MKCIYGEEMLLVFDPYGKFPPRWVCYKCGKMDLGI